MGKETGISWTSSTWNPWRGCHKVSQGCKNCYMFSEQTRYGKDPNTVIRCSPSVFNAPLHWKPGKVFTCSWSDWFIEEADAWRDEAWDIIRKTPQLTYQILTKRPENIRARLPKFQLNNVWIGVSAEDQANAEKRIPYLISLPFPICFVSAEPLLGPLDLGWATAYIDWVIVGGESGANCRSFDIEWARSLRDQCKETGTAFWMKQLGGFPDKRHDPADWPEDLRVQEFPRLS